MKLEKRRMNSPFAFAVVSLLAVAAFSCSGGAGDPGSAAKKMLRAYGGAEKAARLQSFIGRGFIKDLSEHTVARSFTIDIYRKGDLYKHRIVRTSRGAVTDVLMLRYDGATATEWESRRGVQTVPPLELGLLKYRFPAVILWAQGPDRVGEIVPAGKKDGATRIRYRDGDMTAVVAIDAKSGLVRGVEVTSANDTSLAFAESYDHYSDVDGIPFPQEFKATYRGQPFYEYILPTVELAADIPDSLLQFTKEDTARVRPPAAKPAETQR